MHSIQTHLRQMFHYAHRSKLQLLREQPEKQEGTGDLAKALTSNIMGTDILGSEQTRTRDTRRGTELHLYLLQK